MTAEIDRARIIEIAERIRRSARHPDVLVLCDGVLALAVAPPKPVSLTPSPTVAPVSLTPKAERFDRRGYQRDLMRKRRAAFRQPNPINLSGPALHLVRMCVHAREKSLNNFGWRSG
jgi:hypothetical protein